MPRNPFIRHVQIIPNEPVFRGQIVSHAGYAYWIEHYDGQTVTLQQLTAQEFADVLAIRTAHQKEQEQE